MYLHSLVTVHCIDEVLYLFEAWQEKQLIECRYYSPIVYLQKAKQSNLSKVTERTGSRTN